MGMPTVWVIEGPVPRLMLCSRHFENLNTFMSERLFYKWSPVIQCIIYKSKGGIVCVFSSLSPHLHTVYVMPHKHRILVDLWYIGTRGVTKWVQGRHVTSVTDLVEVLTAPRSYAFHLSQNLLQAQKEDNSILIQVTKEPYRIISFLYALLPWTTIYSKIDNIRKKGKGRAIHNPFSFRFFLTQVGRLCACQEGK